MALVRVDLLPTDAGRVTQGPIQLLDQTGREISTAQLLGPAPYTDSPFSGQSLLALASTNAPQLVPGTMLPARIGTGERVSGAIIPRDAIIRYAGTAWSYVQTSGDTFTRHAVELSHPYPEGWPNSKTQTPRLKLQDSNSKTQTPRLKLQDSNSKTQEATNPKAWLTETDHQLPTTDYQPPCPPCSTGLSCILFASAPSSLP